MANAATAEKKGKSPSAPGGNGTMKFTTAQETLAQAADRVLNVVPQKTTMPALGYLLVEATKGSVRITATDLDLTMTTTVEAEVAREGAVSLPAKRFSEIVRQLDPNDDVEIDVSKSSALISGGRANFRILGMSPDEFPNVQSMDFQKGVSIPAETLRKAIQKTVFCVSKDETRRALTGILWELSGQTMGMVGTDGHRLARISVPVDFKFDSKKSVIVPTKALNQVLRLAGDSVDAAMVKIADDHVVFRFDDAVLFTRLIEGPFPKYQDVIPKDNDKKVVVGREALADALRRVSLLADNLTRQIRLSLKRDLIVLSSRTQDIGEASEEIEAQYGGEDMEIGYNAQYFAEILRNIETDEVILSLGTPLNAGLVEPMEQGGDENYLCLIMPLRLVD